MVNIQIISDLHLEFYDDYDYNKFIKPLNNNENNDLYLCLLGDIGNPFNKNYENFISESSKKFEKVFILPGNHEYYFGEYNESKLKIYNICNKYKNVYLMDNNIFEINNYIIIGSTLWSYIDNNSKIMASLMINDYKKIKINNNLYTPDYNNKLFFTNLSYIKNQVEKANINNKQVIILTHHCPSHKFIDIKYKTYPCNCCFVNDLDDFILQNSHIKYWLFGHTHSSFNGKIGNCLCISNPAGYNRSGKFENNNYDITKSINI
jgi:predicted phosphohydrolase